ncbi:hypothetical protein Pint_21283 [Pistacia integerrima]|uniref:Uncharacterized protein n=1 Tax=Pistacia integerrima TaxID=434235 RepID=A0ACC0XBT0_9ROSI|nr:hypothetical protein Pint_21283 [Pistacia integerrima]
MWWCGSLQGRRRQGLEALGLFVLGVFAQMGALRWVVLAVVCDFSIGGFEMLGVGFSALGF